MFKSVLFAGALGSAAALCPTYVRAVNSFMPSASGVAPVDLYVNGEKVQSGVTFRTVTPYLQVPSGQVTVGIRPAGAAASTPFSASATLNVASGKFYTAGFLGMVPAPDGFTPINSAPVLVNEDVRSMPSPGRFSGLWYRWSETNVVIDFRTVGGDPAPADVSGAFDVERITDLQPKTVIPIGELPTGRRYSFYPTLVNSTAPLPNARLTGNGGVVAVRNLLPQSGRAYDFFATGDSLLNPHNFNLEVRYTETPLSFDASTGCTIVPGKADYALAARAAAVNNYGALPEGAASRIDGVTIATLVCAAITLALALLQALRGLLAAPRPAEASKATAGHV